MDWSGDTKVVVVVFKEGVGILNISDIFQSFQILVDDKQTIKLNNLISRKAVLCS